MRAIPYDIRKTADGYHVYRQDTGEDKGVSKTRAKAEAHMRALYANEPRHMSSPGMKHGGSMSTVDDTYSPVPITHAYMGGKRYPVMGASPATPTLPPMASPKAVVATEKPKPRTVSVPKGETVAPIPGMIGGGILKKVLSKPVEKAREVGRQIEHADDVIFGNEGLGSNLRKLKKEFNRFSRGSDGYKSGGVLQKISKTMNKGGLHKSFGIPQGKNIPESRIHAAASKKGKIGKQARLAETFAKFRKG